MSIGILANELIKQHDLRLSDGSQFVRLYVAFTDTDCNETVLLIYTMASRTSDVFVNCQWD